jgi:hypothetical protein
MNRTPAAHEQRRSEPKRPPARLEPKAGGAIALALERAKQKK